MADIPADAGMGMGAFENLHGQAGGSAFSRYLTGQAASVYGAPGRAYVLPHETIGEDGERIVFQTDNAVENTFKSKGTPEAWRERIGVHCTDNSRLVFAVASAFADGLGCKERHE